MSSRSHSNTGKSAQSSPSHAESAKSASTESTREQAFNRDALPLQLALADPSAPLSPSHVAQLQRTLGNRAVAQLMRARAQAPQAVQRAAAPGEEELQLKAASSQRAAAPEAEGAPAQLQPIQRKENRTGMPDQLKAGVEQLSGMDLSDVKVHYNSDKPAQLQALAYAQGSDIHIAPGQEKHLPHETWHVVQQRQGRVNPTMQLKGTQINDSPALEREADMMGAKALHSPSGGDSLQADAANSPSPPPVKQLMQIVQRVAINADIEFDGAAKLIVKGATAPENKAGGLNNLLNAGAVRDPALAANYHNGHMVAAMFGGANAGNNIRVWSDNYEDTHTTMEDKVRYGGGGVGAPANDEKGTVTVTTTDQNVKFPALVDGLYNVVENQLFRMGYWKNARIPPDPKGTIEKGLKGANIHKAVDAIPTQVDFDYTETTGGGRAFNVSTNAGLGDPTAGADAQAILTGLAQYVNSLEPTGTAKPNAKSPPGKMHNALLGEIAKVGGGP